MGNDTRWADPSRTAPMAGLPFGCRYYREHGTELEQVKAKPGDDPAVRPRRWRPGTGIYVIAPVQPSLSAVIGAIQARFDPKLARMMPPHITVIGSSGAGPIAPATPVDELRRALEPI